MFPLQIGRLSLSIAAGMISGALSGQAVLANPVPSGWTGAYVGMTTGVGWNAGDGAHQCIDDNGVADSPFCQLLPIGVDAISDTTGPLLGVHGGLNIDLNGRFVIGAEVDFSMANIRGQNTVAGPFLFPSGATVNPTGEFSSTYTINSLSTLRLRGGIVAHPDLFVYATGGVAMAHIDASSTFVANNVGRSYPGSVSQLAFGFTVGAGVEYALSDGWRVRAEGLYFDLGDVHTRGAPVGIAPPVFNHNATFGVRGALIKVGLSFDLN